MHTVVLDAGHGGRDAGAISPWSGLLEKDVNLQVAKKIGGLLLGRVQVYLTREDDSFLTLKQRRDFSDAHGADLFVSIHANSATSSLAQGAEVWTFPGQTMGDVAANHAIDAWVEAFPHTPFRRDMSDGDGDKEAPFAVLKCAAPAYLWELDFLSSKKGSDRLGASDWIFKASEALSEGMLRFFDLGGKQHPETPPKGGSTSAILGIDRAISILHDTRSLL